MRLLYNSKEKINDFFVDNFTALTKKGYIVSQSEMKKIPGAYSWYQAIMKGIYGYNNIQDFCVKNGIKRTYNKYDVTNAEAYINEYILNDKHTSGEKFIKESALKKYYKDFYKSLINGEIPGYKSYFDLILKKGFRVFIEKSKLQDPVYFNEIYSLFIKPLITNGRLPTSELSKNSYQNFYKALNQGMVEGYSSFKDFKEKNNIL